MKPLEGKVIVVTGATGGIGKAICQVLAQAGANIVIGFNQREAEAQQIIDQLPVVMNGHLVCQTHVTDSENLTLAAKHVAKQFGRCDVVVNCAGTTRFVEHSDLDALDDQLIDQILQTNVRGVIATVRAFKSLLVESGNSVVINISSIAARTAMGSNIAYCASKAAVDNLTMSLARALAPKIRVFSISPGLSDTEFVKGLDDGWRNQQSELTPLGRLAQPDEVADAVLVAISHLTFTTGAVLPVDGGRPLR